MGKFSHIITELQIESRNLYVIPSTLQPLARPKYGIAFRPSVCLCLFLPEEFSPACTAGEGPPSLPSSAQLGPPVLHEGGVSQ